MAILKYTYLSLGVILYVVFNVISYTNDNYVGDLTTKMIFSFISLVFLMLCYALILFSKKLTKKAFYQYPTHLKIALYVGILIAPMISLYYTS
jgi:hypothetical protein